MQQGDIAHKFSLPAARGEIVDVAALVGTGPIVLLFIPFAFSSTCTAELCRVGEEWPDWNADEAHVFGVSADSAYVTARWRAQERIPFPVLADFSRDVIRAYGVLDEGLLGPPGVARRSVFVIDREGAIAYRWVADNPGQEPDYAEVRNVAEGLS